MKLGLVMEHLERKNRKIKKEFSARLAEIFKIIKE